jgi:hypothetical protein
MLRDSKVKRWSIIPSYLDPYLLILLDSCCINNQTWSSLIVMYGYGDDRCRDSRFVVEHDWGFLPELRTVVL